MLPSMATSQGIRERKKGGSVLLTQPWQSSRALPSRAKSQGRQGPWLSPGLAGVDVHLRSGAAMTSQRQWVPTVG